MHGVAENGGHCVVLALEHARLAAELEDALIDAGGFDDAAVERQVTVQHGQTAVLRVSVLLVADAAGAAIQVQRGEALGLRERRLRGHAAGRCAKQLVHGRVVAALDVVAFDGVGHGGRVDGRTGGVEQAAARQFA